MFQNSRPCMFRLPLPTQESHVIFGRCRRERSLCGRNSSQTLMQARAPEKLFGERVGNTHFNAVDGRDGGSLRAP